MAGRSETKSRIESVRETRKITNAMYLIASTKLRKARNDLERTRPYFEALRTEIKRIFRTVTDVESPYFYPPDKDEEPEGAYGCLVITADKGLAGAYNMNALKKAHRLLNEHPDTKLFVVGEYGRRYFDHHKIPIERLFLYTAQNPTLDRAREISSILLERYDAGELKKIFIVYTDLENGLSTRARSARLLPFHRTHFEPPEKEKKVELHFDFEPSATAALHGIVHSYLTGFIYSALIDSFCSEQQARMTAMDAANRNAEELLTDLTIQYNRERQAAITQEITEVTAGAKAQRKKRRKEVLSS